MSSMFDQLGGMGGGGADPSMGGGPPPSLDLSSVMGGGAEGAGENEDYKTPVEALKAAIDDIKKYLDIETDDIDKQVGAELLAKAQSLLAKNQKQVEAAQGVTDVHRGVAKLTSQSQGY